MDRLTFHPLVEIFPKMDDSVFDALVQDMKVNGVREPITVYKNQVLDGKHRFLACEQLGIKCPSCEYVGKESDLLDFVVSKNLHRRQMSDSQKAMTAARIANLKEGRPKKTTEISAVSQSQAAERLGISTDSVQFAKKVIAQAVPEVVKAVDDGDLAVSVAAQLADEPPAFQKRVVAKMANGEAATSADASRQVRNIEAATKLNSIEAIEAKELNGLYDVAVVDPPWPMDKIERDTRPEQVSYDYPVMDVAKIASEVGAHLAEHLAADAHVFLWTTQKFLPVAFGLIEQWNLAYGYTLVWHKNGGFQRTPAGTK